MHKCSLGPYFYIQIFAEGGGGDGGTGGGDAAGAAGAANAGVAPQQTGGKNPLAGVQYGKQEQSDAGVATQVKDRNAEFEALIKGEYKDLYDQRMQDTIQKRLKGQAETVNRYNELTPVLQMLGQKYGVDANDAKALSKAIEEDNSFYEDEAMEKGLTVEQLKEIRKMERENASLRQQMEERQTREQADALYSSWLEQAEQVKQVYPGFDLQAELDSEEFRNLLRSNVPIKTAFEVLHKDEILPAAMQFTAQKVSEKITNSIKAGRPAEGAMGGGSSVIIKSDVSQLTKADRDEIDRRVARGERIVF